VSRVYADGWVRRQTVLDTWTYQHLQRKKIRKRSTPNGEVEQCLIAAIDKS